MTSGCMCDEDWLTELHTRLCQANQLGENILSQAGNSDKQPRQDQASRDACQPTVGYTSRVARLAPIRNRYVPRT